jgi:hypothetical protein
MFTEARLTLAQNFVLQLKLFVPAFAISTCSSVQYRCSGETAIERVSDMPRDVPSPRSRSRSPYRPSNSRHERHRSSRDRSRSPRRIHHHHHSRHAHKPSATPTVTPTAPVKLPFKAGSLSRHDLATFRPMFALYLDIQKNILIEDLVEEEVKGRWKSFIGKW